MLMAVGEKPKKSVAWRGKKKPQKPTTPLRLKNKNKTGSRTQYTDVVQIIPAPGSAPASSTHRKPPGVKSQMGKK